MRLLSRLTERDRQIALDCWEHRVLTTEQVSRLHFTGKRTASARLRELYALRVLDRFRPAWRHGEGSTPHHWVLDEAGARLVAAELGTPRSELRWRHDTALAIAGSGKLRHQIEANEFFTRLAEQARLAGGALREWYGERTTHELLGRTVVPDGYGVLVLPGQRRAHILLELDRGTERPYDRLAEKAQRYTAALPKSDLRHVRPLVLFAVPNEARAHGAALAIRPSGAPASIVVWTPSRADRTLAHVHQAIQALR